jgi:DNA-directed RNA polymerase specialized sigma24 family protein
MGVVDAVRGRELEAFYAAHHRFVARVVPRHVSGWDEELIADACAYAWLMLVRRGDIGLDARGVQWVITVAVRQAWALERRNRQELPCGTLGSDADPGELGEPAGLDHDPLDRVIALEEHAARCARFAYAKPRERRELLLKAAGYRYREIAALTGSTYTAVNRRLTEGRRRALAGG